MTATATTHPSFLTIPQELTEHVLKFCAPDELANFAATCRLLRDIVYNGDDQAVWRVAYLSYPFDDPRRSLSGSHLSNAEVDWRGDMQRRVEAQKVMSAQVDSAAINATYNLDEFSLDLGDDEEDRPLHRALCTLISAVGGAPQGSEGTSCNLTWVQSTLLGSPLFKLINQNAFRWLERDWGNPDGARQHFARLQSYLALSHEQDGDRENDARMSVLRTASRCFVYDLRKYQSDTLWGPYILDANRRLRVNWEHVRHIQNVVLMNLKDFPDSWEKVWPEWGIQSIRPYSAPSVQNRKPWDWAGVEGKWRRVVCFMDYRDLFTFNFSSQNSGPRNPNFFDDDFTEAVRLMEVNLEVTEPPDASSPASSSSLSSSSSSSTSSSSLFSSSDSAYTDGWDSKYPTIHFTGSSHGVHSGASKIRGTVRMMRDGAVRWNFVTSYDDSTNRWSAEAVQVGNIGSAMGIAGIWTVAVHEEVGDPAGPFWMWKAPESLPKDLEHLTF